MICFHLPFNWPIFTQPGKLGTGKNTKSLFFLLRSGQEFEKKLSRLKTFLKPSRKNKDFVFLPVPNLPGWVKIDHLNG